MKTHHGGHLRQPRLPPPRLLLIVCCLLAAFPSREEGGMMAAASETRTLHSKTRSATHTTGSTCVHLKGIESNATGSLDPAAYLDLDVIKRSLALEVFDLSNPVVPTVANCSAGLETPIAMRNILEIDTAVFSVSSMFHTNYKALDIFGDKVTSDARRRCQPTDLNDDEAKLLYDLHLRVAIVYTFVYTASIAMPFCIPQLEALMKVRGHPLSLIQQENLSVDTPWGLAKAYVDEVIEYMLKNDGWNADGSESREFNRIPFSDFAAKDSAGNTWTPYQPQNSPYKLTKRRRWQPLIESDGLGYLSTQEHVTPHIGVTARFFGFNSKSDEHDFSSRQLDQPEYRSRYDEVAQEVLDESEITASDPFKQAAVRFFDNKFGSLVPLKAQFFVTNADRFTSLEFYRVTVAVQLAIYNGIVLAWREKIRHDLPRPPTVVRDKLGDTMVQAYAGPPEDGVRTMKASEWEPLIRTMPHSEFPSASACVCQVFAEQVLNFVGTDEIVPDLQLAPFPLFSFSSWSEISQVCGDSRVWGGMHFEGAVPAGVELCGGGDMAASIDESLTRLVDGDEDAAIFDRNIGELMLRPL